METTTMMLWYTVSIRDNSSTGGGTPIGGCLPSWRMFASLSGGTPITPCPEITELSYGVYRFQYDVEAQGEAVGQIDAGNPALLPGDRYIDQALTLESTRLISAINSQGQVHTVPNTLTLV
jgi:hypothetical protein